MRMSQTFSRASERIDTHHGEGRRRAARQSAKYDVTWREDDESECCRVCFAMFTKLSRRRHHCRVCGELVCGACSQDQVSLTDKFSTPRRACVACCSLLQAMACAGDDRVKVVEPDAATATPVKRHHQSAPAASCHSPAGNSMPAPAATPRYRDRLTEVHRVMAAGKLSRRRGSAEKKMFVISSRWLRTWLAFTSSASSNSSRNLDYGFEPEKSSSPPTARATRPHLVPLTTCRCWNCPVANSCVVRVSSVTKFSLVMRRAQSKMPTTNCCLLRCGRFSSVCTAAHLPFT